MLPVPPVPWTMSMLLMACGISFGIKLWESTMEALKILDGATGEVCSSVGLVLIPNNNCIDSLKNLTKLSFLCASFEGKTINTFSKLPKLEVLRLMECKWIGGEWELLETESFDQLIYLKISASNLERWEASACHFSNLERLVLDWCEELETIPAEFAEIPNLKSIELYGCLHSAVESAKEIQREQHEQGNDNMVVIEEDTKELKAWNVPSRLPPGNRRWTAAAARAK
nr:putative late blight resistance protein homolog R1B-16 isoform X1 [Ipomoea batatas]